MAVPDAHNGFLEICIDLGLVGLAVYVWVVFQTIIKAIALIRATRSNEYIWVLMFFTYSTVANLSESSLLFRNSLPSVIFAAVSFTVAANYYQQFKVNPSNFSTQISEQPLPEPLSYYRMSQALELNINQSLITRKIESTLKNSKCLFVIKFFKKNSLSEIYNSFLVKNKKFSKILKKIL